MCGIVGAVAERDVVPILMEGLRRLEYRGYDSAGIAVLNGTKHLTRLRTVGKVRMLDEALEQPPTAGKLGIAHTRWATHGVPSERNAHPHISRDGLAIVHNGIIENHEELRADLERRGYRFSSETDTEVVAHRVHYHLQTVKDLFKAVRATVAELEGAYALAVVSEHEPERLIVAREGCPVVLGLGKDENFVASDVAALLPVTRRFIFLEEGDVAEVRRRSVRVIDRDGHVVERAVRESDLSADAAERGPYPHYMLKEIHQQPRAGPEIGVASTKAFTTQLAALGMLVIALARHNGADAERERGLVTRLIELPGLVEKTLELDAVIQRLAERFADKHHALFLGRGALFPVALEGALKLKEISYIHAEGYPAGELKHGPLALVDAGMPVVAVAPNNDLLEKLKSNLMEVRARGGELFVFADSESGIRPSDGVTVIEMPRRASYVQAPVVYTIPLQLLAYHVAILRGTDVDQPRNLAKSVTVE